MSKNRLRLIGAITMAAALALPSGLALADGAPSADELRKIFRDKTITFMDHRTNLPTTIYMGRWGSSFEKYVPCVNSDGTWRISKRAEICFKDREGGAPETCLKPKFGAAQMTFSDDMGNPLATARLERGNKLPLG